MENQIETVAILGSNSFTGSHLINHILEKTNFKVIGISRSEEYPLLFLPYLYKKERRPTNFKFYKLDLNKEEDLHEIIKIFDKEKPQIIFNYAAQGEVRNSWKYPEQWFRTNCLAVVKLTNILKEKNYIKRYVAISTPEVYGSSNKQIDENQPYNPSTPYAASKLAGDLFLNTIHKRYNFPVIFIRSANVYGIHQQLYRIIPRSIIYLNSKKEIKLHGEGKAKRTFIHVRDAVYATLRIALEGKVGQTYNLSVNMNPITIAELVNEICKLQNKDFSKSVELVKEDFGQDNSYFLDSTKVYNLLKWKPKITLKEGINETIKWIEDNWKDINSRELNYIHKE